MRRRFISAISQKQPENFSGCFCAVVCPVFHLNAGTRKSSLKAVAKVFQDAFGFQTKQPEPFRLLLYCRLLVVHSKLPAFEKQPESQKAA